MGRLFLAWRHARYHWGRSIIIVACVACAAYLPLAVNLLISRGEARLLARAEATPLVMGAAGSRVDLVLHALHFRMRHPGALTMGDIGVVRAGGLARVIPLCTQFTARSVPIVGTSPAYFRFRGLSALEGSLPLALGDCVLGAEAAKGLGLGVGEKLLSDPANLFDIAGAYPLRMHVAGVLAPIGTDDDRAVFVDMKTAWVIAGLGHGHQDVARADDALVLKRTESQAVANAALPQFTEITPENVTSFHFHGDTEGFPVTAAIVLPEDDKSAVLLAGRFAAGDHAGQLVEPTEVVREMLGTVFRVKRLFDANVALVAVAMVLLLGLVVLLSCRMRAAEMALLHRIGCARGTLFWLQAWELAMLLGLGLGLAVAASLLTSHFSDVLVRCLFA